MAETENHQTGNQTGTVDEDAHQSLDDLTVLQNVADQNLGEVRLNVARPVETSDGQLSRLADIHAGSTSAPQVLVQTAAGVGKSADLDIAIDHAGTTGTIDAIDTIQLAPSNPNEINTTVSTAPASIAVSFDAPILEQPKAETPEPVAPQSAPVIAQPAAAAAAIAQQQSQAPTAEAAAEDQTTTTTTLDNTENSAPTTSDVNLGSVNEDHSITFTKAQLLANATDADGDTLSVSNINVSNGTLVENADGTYTFTPDANYNGEIDLTYTISDGNGGTTTGSASFEVAAVNDGPTTSAVSLTGANEDNSVTFTKAQLLANASDIEGDTLSVASVSANNGTLVENADGTYTFTPDANYNGAVDV
ncbi:hypothetical protein CU669_18560, partial [Paramagnetospirillum kuznetsovii]